MSAFSVANLGGNETEQPFESRIATMNEDLSRLATGVDQIRLTLFGNNLGDGLVVYREVDVYGNATVPEPSSLTLLATFLFGLLAYAWRRRK